MQISGFAGDVSPEFEQFVRDFRPSFRLSAIGGCDDWHTAEDLVQDALVILHRRWYHIEPHARVAYVRVVISHLVAQMRRSGRCKHESPSDTLPELTHSSHEEEIADRLVIKGALDDLPARQRSAVYLRYWSGLSTEEIASALHVPSGTVRSDLTRAATRLRRVLSVQSNT